MYGLVSHMQQKPTHCVHSIPVTPPIQQIKGQGVPKSQSQGNYTHSINGKMQIFLTFAKRFLIPNKIYNFMCENVNSFIFTNKAL